MQETVNIVSFIVQYKLVLLNIAGLFVLYALIEFWAWLMYGPRDTSGNGITVGDAKAFDNRSLTLRVERLSSHLATLKVVNQNITENLTQTQSQVTTHVTREMSADLKATPATAKEKEGESNNAQGSNSSKVTSKNTVESVDSTNPPVALAASDVLSDQLNLASQILNLETLYERSLTDRLLNNKTRLQAVLGFQVSITPPTGCEDAVAVVEIGVRMKGTNEPVSLVALIPHEKSYNSQTFSTSAYSMGGSAVTNVLSLGVNRKGETQQLFIHRDSDTIAFERDDQSRPSLFYNHPNERVFGWEFRPVLGRRSVAPGTRQMLAVIALPVEDPDQKSSEPATLEIRTRSYWRYFNARKQTTRGKWGLLPWSIDRSLCVNSQPLDLTIPTTTQIQEALAPRVTDVKWVNSGGDRATVLVTGSNFFTGTKVVIGGVTHTEGDEQNKLVLKSNQALEFETAIASLGKGDCVLSGRFGPSIQLKASLRQAKEKKINALSLVGAVVTPSAFTDAVYLVVEVKAIDEDAQDVDLEVADIQKLPEPLLFVGSESIPLPYDYFDTTSEAKSETTASANADESQEHKTEVAATAALEANVVQTATTEAGEPASDKEPVTILARPSTAKYVRVGAWISKKLAASPSVTFRVPFCGLEYQASVPLIYSDPTVSRLGDEGEDCVFRIASPVGFRKPFRVELDDVYYEGYRLKRMSPFDYRFKVPIAVASRYRSIVIRTGNKEPYLLPISVEEKSERKTAVNTSGKPPHITKDTAGSLEWSGTALDLVKTITLVTRKSEPNSTAVSEVRNELDFTVYDDGKKLELYFAKPHTEASGKAALEFLTNDQTKIVAPLFITENV